MACDLVNRLNRSQIFSSVFNVQCTLILAIANTLYFILFVFAIFCKKKNQNLLYFPYEISIEHEYTKVYCFLFTVWILLLLLLIQIKYNFLAFDMRV